MTRLTQIYTTTALATLLATSPVMADVTAPEVWDDWRSLMARTGAQVGFEQSGSDGILTINNLTFTTKPRGGDGAAEINLGSLVFQEQNDGSVLVLLPTDAPIVVTIDDEKLTLNQRHKDLSLVVSGAPKDLTYTYKATALSLTLVELIIAGKNSSDLIAEITLSDLNGTTRFRDADLQEATHETTIGALTYNFDFNFVDQEAKFTSQGSVTDLQNSFSVAIPKNVDDMTLQEALNAGLRAVGHMGYGKIDTQISLDENGGVLDASFSAENGILDMKFDRDENNLVVVSQNISFGPTKLRSDFDERGEIIKLDFAVDQLGAGYEVSFPDDFKDEHFGKDSFQKAIEDGLSFTVNVGFDELASEFSGNNDAQAFAGNVVSASADLDLFLEHEKGGYAFSMGNTNMRLSSPEIPSGALEFSASEIHTNLMIPLSVSNTPAPFSYKDRYIDLSISEGQWALFDPDKLLPRSAVTYILDLEGMANWLIDPFSEEFQVGGPGTTKGELHSLTLNEFQLTGAGVDLTGTGAFTFNNDDLETFDGFPAPTGALDLKMVGLNTLLDTLIKIGLLKEDQAFGARMGLGLFTMVGDSDDTLISHIETTDDGHVLANGKRLK